jgi:hypothetical protein
MIVNELSEYQSESHITIRNDISSYLTYQIPWSHYIVLCGTQSLTASRVLSSSIRCSHLSPHPTIAPPSQDKVPNHQQTQYRWIGQYGSFVYWVPTRFRRIGVEYNLQHRPIQLRYLVPYRLLHLQTIQLQYHHLLPCLVMRGILRSLPISLHPG